MSSTLDNGWAYVAWYRLDTGVWLRAGRADTEAEGWRCFGERHAGRSRVVLPAGEYPGGAEPTGVVFELGGAQ